MLDGIARRVAVAEKLLINEVVGTWEIYLEPTFGHFMLHPLSGNEDAIVVDKSLFYVGVGTLDVSAARQNTGVFHFVWRRGNVPLFGYHSVELLGEETPQTQVCCSLRTR